MRRTLDRVALGGLCVLALGCGEGSHSPHAAGLRIVLVADEGGGAAYAACKKSVPVTATVTRAGGGPASGVLLKFAVLSGDGRVEVDSSATDAQGVVHNLWTLGPTADVGNELAVRAIDPTSGALTPAASISLTTASRIAYNKPLGGGAVELHSAYPDGSADRLLFSGPGLFPTWSPDGRRIAFSRRYIHERGGFYLVVVNADGSGAESIIDSSGSAIKATWSPDGRTLAYFYTPNLVYHELGGTVRYVAAYGRYPFWSPDGALLGFSYYWGGATSPLLVMNPDGSDVRMLAEGGDEGDWSPDGGMVAFVPGERIGWQIEVVGVDGSGRHAIGPETARAEYPSWSPSGQRILHYRAGVGLVMVGVQNGAEQSFQSVDYSGLAYGGNMEAADWSACME